MALIASNEITKKMMRAFSDQMNAVPTGFLKSFFGKNPSEIYISDSETVEIDIERYGEEVAVDVKRGADGNLNVYGKYTTKLYKPPLYNEYTNLEASQLTKRMPGQDPYAPVNKNANAMQILFKTQFEESKKILRALELQASEALFSGTITFKNADQMDFKRKSSHNITPVVKWDNASSTPLLDLTAACSANRIDGKVQSDTVIMGTELFEAYQRHATVQTMLDNRRINIGEIRPRFVNEGAVFQGYIWLPGYRLELYTYDQYYTDAAGSPQPYTPLKQALVFYSGARLNESYGAVDILRPAEAAFRSLGVPRVPALVPGKIVPYAYTIKESNLVAGIKSAPILIPTQIDAISNINGLA